MHTKQVAFFVLLALTVVSQSAFSAPAEKPRNERVVKDGLMVSLEYTLKSPDGKIIETSKGKEPLKYIHGRRMMIPGLERELSGMKIGGEKHVTVKPEDAYGKVDPNAVQEFPKDQIPPNGLQVGAVLAARTPDGGVVPMTVREIKEKTVVMDMNHPMAGKILVFDVKIVDIQPAPASKPAEPVKPSPAPKGAKSAEPATK